MTLVRCDTNYYYGALFFGEKKIMAVALMFFVECEKMTLIECDTMGLIFWGPKARAFLALWSRHPCVPLGYGALPDVQLSHPMINLFVITLYTSDMS